MKALIFFMLLLFGVYSCAITVISTELYRTNIVEISPETSQKTGSSPFEYGLERTVQGESPYQINLIRKKPDYFFEYGLRN